MSICNQLPIPVFPSHHLVVVDRSDPNRLLGSLSEQNVIKAYNREMSRRDLAGTIASLTGAPEGA